MKMRMFGLGATLALAMLASVSLTSCYDSEHLDITAPTVLDAPVYVVSGYVWDFVTGDEIAGATVSTPGGTATTDATGFFAVKAASPMNGTITFTKEGYDAQTRNIAMESAKTGVVSYNASCYLIKISDIPGIQLLEAVEESSEDFWTVREELLLDLVNESSDPKEFKVKFGHLKSGASFVDLSDETKAETQLPDAVKDKLAEYIKARFGADPREGIEYVEEEVPFTLPGQSSLYAVQLVQYGVTLVFTFTLDDVIYVASAQVVIGHDFTPTIYDNSHYHGTGHGHNSHGGVINAGGGIFED